MLPHEVPARASDLSGLPPVFIEVGAAEVFRDEAVEFAGRIWATGGQAELHVWAGGHHGFAGTPGARVSRAARAGAA
ncbi:alpha/beta hydrolase [Nonomuraea sp. NPDC052265]|uniref:alpha/beta hydrolase n=1 Tax=Nonomuraea sp. NPDC052265 TaxID=3364374 RepID=UPI0037C5D785